MNADNELVWMQIRELGGRNAVYKLVLAMMEELAQDWERLADGAPENEAVPRAGLLRACAAQVRTRLELVGGVR